MLLRLVYLGITNGLAMLRLLPMSDRAKDAEILALRHQLAVLERQLHSQKVQFTPADRAFLAACSTDSPVTSYATSGSSYGPRRSCAGTATCSPADTRPSPAPSDRPASECGQCPELSLAGHGLSPSRVLDVNGHHGARPALGGPHRVLPVPRPQRLGIPRFVLDVHLGALTRWMRLLGIGCAYRNDATDPELVAQANAQRRILLTEDQACCTGAR